MEIHSSALDNHFAKNDSNQDQQMYSIQSTNEYSCQNFNLNLNDDFNNFLSPLNFEENESYQFQFNNQDIHYNYPPTPIFQDQQQDYLSEGVLSGNQNFQNEVLEEQIEYPNEDYNSLSNQPDEEQLFNEEYQQQYQQQQIEESPAPQLSEPKPKRVRCINAMNKYSCEETKNFFNHTVPFVERRLCSQWNGIKELLPCLSQQKNRKSLKFTITLAEEAGQLNHQDYLRFKQEILKISIMFMSWAHTHQKEETSYVLLKYSSAFFYILLNPNSFNSIKAARQFLINSN